MKDIVLGADKIDAGAEVVVPVRRTYNPEAESFVAGFVRNVSQSARPGEALADYLSPENGVELSVGSATSVTKGSFAQIVVDGACLDVFLNNKQAILLKPAGQTYPQTQSYQTGPQDPASSKKHVAITLAEPVWGNQTAAMFVNDALLEILKNSKDFPKPNRPTRTIPTSTNVRFAPKRSGAR